jgi:hypothetical protein
LNEKKRGKHFDIPVLAVVIEEKKERKGRPQNFVQETRRANICARTSSAVLQARRHHSSDDIYFVWKVTNPLHMLAFANITRCRRSASA